MFFFLRVCMRVFGRCIAYIFWNLTFLPRHCYYGSPNYVEINFDIIACFFAQKHNDIMST